MNSRQGTELFNEYVDPKAMASILTALALGVAFWLTVLMAWFA